MHKQVIKMAKEIERKFLVCGTEYRTQAEARYEIMQGYLSADPDATVRVRIAGDNAFITVKSRNSGAVRNEWEYPVPAADAREMLRVCNRGRLIEKTRYIVSAGNGLRWEVDEFHGALDGLVVAEIELPSEDTVFGLPAFVGEEVTGDAHYYNSSLAAL